MCMHANFGGRGPFGFRDMATFQKWPNFPFGASKNSMVIEKFNQSEKAQKFMQVGIDVKCMHAVLVGVASSVLEIWLPFKNGQISLSGHGL